MTREGFAAHLLQLHEQEIETRSAGQKEYAHNDDNAFANFERVAERMGITREQALMVYLEKHMDGIHSYIKGHHSQRESVHGRIKDARLYLALLDGMVTENERSATDVERVERPFVTPDEFTRAARGEDV